MAESWYRTQLLLGDDALDLLAKSKVIIFGIGGVGGYVAEALARSGVGEFMLVDHDTIAITNINRQIIALNSTIGQHKVDVMKQRIIDINPSAKVEVLKEFYLPENSHLFDLSKYDYIIDAIDTVSAKIHLAVKAEELGIKIISSMGTGNKINPIGFEVADIYKTKVCPLAKVVRKELKDRGVKALKVVYSQEMPREQFCPKNKVLEKTSKRVTPASISFVPPISGLIIASEVVKDLIF